MANLTESLNKLENLYNQLPDMPCTSCGLCCVNPDMTFIEFAWLIKNMTEQWSKEKIINLVTTEPAAEPRYKGNFVCRIQNNKSLCDLHQFRPMICRLEGLPVLNRMGIRDYVICPYILDEQMKREIKAEEIDGWVSEVFNLSGEFYPVYEEPYWLSALNIESWFAIAFDNKISQTPVLKVKKLINDNLDLDFLAAHYKDYTKLSEKLNYIDHFFEEAETNKNPKKAINILKDIQNKFPLTGSYYYDEAEKYLSLMKKIIREQRKVN